MCALLEMLLNYIFTVVICEFQKKHRDVFLSLTKEKGQTPTPANQPSCERYFPKKEKYSDHDKRQVQLTDSIVMFIAGDLLPLSTVESPNFQKMCEQFDPRYQPPSRSKLSTCLIVEKATDIQSKLKAKLSNTQDVCLTLDLWSNRQMTAFLGITGHYVFDWCLQSVMLECKRVKGRHTSDNIRHYFEETLACYNIADKICCVVTDNASNMLKAFVNLPGYTEPVVDTECSDDESDDHDNPEQDMHEDTHDCLPLHIHLPCYAHTLQLVIRDGLKESGQHLKGIIAKAASIVGSIRKSVHATEILESEKRVQAQNLTRWNSQIIMIRSLLNIPDSKFSELDLSVKLTTYEKKLLKELCEILSPFEEATNLIQKQNSVTASLPIPVTEELKQKLQCLSSKFSCKLVTTFKESLTKRMSKYQENEHLKLATALDPRFKLQWCSSESEQTSIESLLTMKAQHVCVNDNNDTEMSPPSKQGRTGFFTILSNTPRKRHPSQKGAKILDYLSAPVSDIESDPLVFWKDNELEYPHLAKLAKKYLAIQASSAAVERLFSIAGKVFRPDRCRLKDETFERLMMIRCNAEVPKSTTKCKKLKL